MTNPEYRKAVLDNGVTLVAERHDHVRAVSIGVWVKVGSSFESAAQNGISHFIEHMTFKGTDKRSPLEIATVLESLGGDLNAFTDREVTCYHATVLTEHVDIALDVLSDLVIRAAFPKQEFERERKVLLQELSMIEESPEDWIHDLFFQSVWKGDPLGQPVIGSKKNILNISRATMMRFFQEHYRAENIVISVAGNLDFDELQKRCEKYFSFSSAQESLRLTPAPSVYKPRKKMGLTQAEQLHLVLGFEAVGFKSPFRFDALILSFFLGGGMSSRLFQEIREKAALAYSVDCDYIPFSDTGLFTIYAAMAPKSLQQCLDIVGREIEKLKENSLTDKELDMVKGQLKGTILLCADQMETRQESLGRNEIVFGRYIPLDEIVNEIERVSTERIFDIARKLFVAEKETIVTLSKAKPKVKRASIFTEKKNGRSAGKNQ